MHADRRTIVKAMAAGAVVATGSTGAVAATHADPALVHHVFFWLNNAGSAADRATLIAGLQTLRAIPVIRALHIGTPAPTEQRDVVDASWDVSELMFFDNAVDQKTYQDHPIHQAFIAKCEKLWRKVVVYDALGA